MPTRVGDRVRLVRCTDPHTQIKPGARGDVDYIDAMGTIHVRWEDGSNLGLIPGVDIWEIIH